MTARTVRRTGPDAAEAALEAQADRLLWEQGRPTDLEYSFYRDATLRRTNCPDHGRMETPPPVAHDPSDREEALGTLLEALLSEAGLPQGSRRVLALVRRGLSYQQIATALGIRLRTAQRWHQRALAQLRSYCASQTDGETARNLEAAYREQITPGSHHRELHCKAGQEACARDGLCKYRWYLYREADPE